MITKQIKEDGTVADYFDVSGTSLQGYITTSYDSLVAVFGEPNAETDGYKVDAEWHLMTPAGVATIYNYKDGENYLGQEGKPVEDITDWHIGGKHTGAFRDVVDYIGRAVKDGVVSYA